MFLFGPSPWLEWLRVAIALGMGLLCFRLGFRAYKSTALRYGIIGIGLIAALAGASANFDPARSWFGPYFSPFGGPAVPACWGALALVGAVWRAQGKSARRGILFLAIIFSCLVLAVVGSGSLLWRYFGRNLRANFPDSRGLLQQSLGITCGAASGAMLLHRHGIKASEGEVAELANTNPLTGTELYALARAVDFLVRRKGLRSCARHADYDFALNLHQPFAAFMILPGIGGHSVLVVQIDANQVQLLDPLYGSEDRMTRAEFEEQWRHVMVWVDRWPDR